MEQPWELALTNAPIGDEVNLAISAWIATPNLVSS